MKKPKVKKSKDLKNSLVYQRDLANVLKEEVHRLECQLESLEGQWNIVTKWISVNELAITNAKHPLVILDKIFSYRSEE